MPVPDATLVEDPRLRHLCPPWLFALGDDGMFAVFADPEGDSAVSVLAPAGGGTGYAVSGDAAGTVSVGGSALVPEFLGHYDGKPVWRLGSGSSARFLLHSRLHGAWIIAPGLREPLEWTLDGVVGGDDFYSSATLPGMGSANAVSFAPRGSNAASGSPVSVHFSAAAWECGSADGFDPCGAYSPVSGSDASGTLIVGLPSWSRTVRVDGKTQRVSLVRGGWGQTPDLLSPSGAVAIPYDAEAGGWVAGADGQGRWIADELPDRDGDLVLPPRPRRGRGGGVPRRHRVCPFRAPPAAGPRLRSGIPGHGRPDVGGAAMTAADIGDVLEMLHERWTAATRDVPTLTLRYGNPAGFPDLAPGGPVCHAFLLDLERAVHDCATLYYAKEADDALRAAYGPSSGESPVGYLAPSPGLFDDNPSFPDDPGGFHSIGASYPMHQGAHAYRDADLPLVPPPGTPLDSPALDGFLARLRAILASCRWIDWSGGSHDPRRCGAVARRDNDLETWVADEGNGAYIPQGTDLQYEAYWTEYPESADGYDEQTAAFGGPCHEPPEDRALEFSGYDRFLLCPAIAGTYHAHAVRPGVRYLSGNAGPQTRTGVCYHGDIVLFLSFGLGLLQGWTEIGAASADGTGWVSLVWLDRADWDASGVQPAGAALPDIPGFRGCGRYTNVRAGFKIDLLLFHPTFRIRQ